MSDHLTKSQVLKELRKLLIHYWDDKSDLDRLLSDAGVEKANVDMDGGMVNVMHRVIMEAVKRDRINHLVTATIDVYPASVNEIKQTLRRYEQATGEPWMSPDDPEVYPFNKICPYPGLRRFEQGDRSYFFGRDILVRDLRRSIDDNPLTLVIGHSGSGKSSVLRAGVIPSWLEANDGQSKAITLEPDVDPFEALYVSLVSAGYDQTSTSPLKEPQSSLFQVLLKRFGGDGVHWLILIDQFEQIFSRTLQSSPEKCKKFIASLVDIAQINDPHFRIVIVMRDDFFGELRDYGAFHRIVDRNIHRVIEMDGEALREIIERPAAEHGVMFDDGLVDQIVVEVEKGRRGMLPLLQYTLEQLWCEEELGDRKLTMSTYDTIGGVSGALRSKAQVLYQSLDPVMRRALRRIMLHTVEISHSETGAGIKPVSRRALKSDIQNETDLSLFDRLVNEEKLLVTSGENDSWFELPHEAIITAWPDFEEWVEESREAIRLRNQLKVDELAWRRHMTNNNVELAADELWRGSKLQRALEIKNDNDFDRLDVPLTDEVSHFLDKSRDSVRTEQERRIEELDKARNEAQKKAEKAGKRQTRLLSTLAIVLAISLLLVISNSNLRDDKSELIAEKTEIQETLAEALVVLDLVDNSLPDDDVIPERWRYLASKKSRKSVGRLAQSIGYITNQKIGMIGTAFVVAPDLIMTAAFVVPYTQIDSTSISEYVISFDDRIGARQASYPVTDIVYQAPKEKISGIAILRVQGLDMERHPPLPLDFSPTYDYRDVAVIGYPAADSRVSTAIQESVFRNQFGIKRMMPGTVLGFDNGEIRYQAAGGGGLSGGPIIDLSRWAVVGVHYGATYNGADRQRVALASRLYDELQISAVSKILSRGFDQSFISGLLAPMPLVPEALRGDILNGAVIDAVHYSFAIHEGRGMPMFVAYNIDRDKVFRTRRGNIIFLPDPKVPKNLQILGEAYLNNPFDRGHLARSSAIDWGETQSIADEANRNAFYYTNIVPQLNKFNRGIWFELEEYVSDSVFPESERLAVITGPVFRRSDVEYRRMRVPRSYWKIIIGLKGGKGAAEAYLMDQYEPIESDSLSVPEPVVNHQGDLQAYRVPISTIEELTLLDFGKLKELDPMGAIH